MLESLSSQRWKGVAWVGLAGALIGCAAPESSGELAETEGTEPQMLMTQLDGFVSDRSSFQPEAPRTGNNVLPLLLAATRGIDRGQYRLETRTATGTSRSDQLEAYRRELQEPRHQKAFSYLVLIKEGDYLWFERDYENQLIYHSDTRHYFSIRGIVEALGIAGILALDDCDLERATHYFVLSRRWANALASDPYSHGTAVRLEAEFQHMDLLFVFWERCGADQRCLNAVETILDEPILHHFARDLHGDLVARTEYWHWQTTRWHQPDADEPDPTTTPEALNFLANLKDWHVAILPLFQNLDRGVLPRSEEELSLLARGERENFTLQNELKANAGVVQVEPARLVTMAETMLLNRCIADTAVTLNKMALLNPEGYKEPDTLFEGCQPYTSVGTEAVTVTADAIVFTGQPINFRGHRLGVDERFVTRLSLPLGKSDDPRVQAYWTWLETQPN